MADRGDLQGRSGCHEVGHIGWGFPLGMNFQCR